MSRGTIVDIANELKISPSTVSRALRDHPDISKKTKHRVIETAERLDYFPDSLAQGLKSRKTNTIGIIVPEIRHHYFSSAISGIEEVTYRSDFTIMVCQSNEDYQREEINLRALVSNRMAGLLISISQTTTSGGHFDILRRRGIPIVFFDRINDSIEGSQVIVNDYQGAFDAASHLAERGYKRIAHIAGPSTISIGRNRFLGYRDALEQHDLPFSSELVVEGGFRENDGKVGINKLLSLSKKPDAVFAVNDPVAIGAYSVLKERKFKIPDDIALVGFSNNPISALLEPPLTTVNQPSYEIGKTAASLLLEQIHSEEKHPVPVIKEYQTQLIIRKSS